MNPREIIYRVATLPMTAGGAVPPPPPPPPTGPSAGFYGVPLSGTVPLAVFFTSTATGAGLTYDWDFGDGSGHSASANPAHTYLSPGAYSVTQTVTDSDGLTSTLVRTAYVTATAATLPVLNVSAGPTSGTVNVVANGPTITNNGPGSCAWSITPTPGTATMAPSSGTLSVGASITPTITALAAASYSMLVENGSGGTVTGSNPTSFTASVTADTTPPSGSGGIAITGLSDTGYTATAPVYTDATGPVSWQWSIGTTPGTWTTIASNGRVYTRTGGTPGAAEKLWMRAFDAVSPTPNYSAPISVDVTFSVPGTGPFSVIGFDAQTPEQISFCCPLTRSAAAGTKVLVRFKPTGASTWQTAHPLIFIDPAKSETGGPEPIVEAYGGSIFDLAPGVTYDVEVTIQEPGHADVVLTGTRATRALPAASGAATKNWPSMGGTLQAAFDGLVPGDVLQIAAGTHDVSSLLLNVQGSAGSPIYIRGASRSGTIIRDLAVESYTGIVTTRNAAHVVIEDLTLQGDGVDHDLSDPFSTGLSFHPGGTTIRPTNITVRRVSILGTDRGVVGYLETDGALIYDCTVTGNNTWDRSYTDNPGAPSTYPNWTWNDDGIRLPGDGHFAFNNTLSGFGDCFANGGSPSDGFKCHATYYARNKILRTGDDLWEADYASRNVAFYDNYCGNSGTAFSADPVYGGPSWFFRNVCINAWRAPFKWNSENSGMLVYANTIIKGGNVWRGSGDWLWNQPNNGGASPAFNWVFRNNLLFKSETSPNTTNILSFDANGSDYYNADHNGWYSGAAGGDGWFSWPNQLGTSQAFNSLSAARTGLPALSGGFVDSVARHTGDIVLASDVFNPALPLTVYTTEYTGMALPTLRAGTTARNAGLAVPGITDGFSGAAPDLGALISGRALVQYGDQNGAALNLVSSVWTPNRDGAGDVLLSDFAALPTMQWIDVAGPNNTLRSVQETPDLLTSSGAPDNNSLTNPWCGAAWDAAKKRLIVQGGGHGDGHPCSNGIFSVSAVTMRCARLVDRTPTAYLNQYNVATRVFEAWNPAQYGYYGVPWVLANGHPSSSHTYHGLQHIPAATMVALGYAGNVNGGLLTTWPYVICNLDTGAYNVPYWTTTGDVGGGIDLGTATSWAAKFLDGAKAVMVSNDFSSRVIDLATPSPSRWSAEVGGTNSFCSIGPLIPHVGFKRAACLMIRMPERREWASLGVSLRTRIRVGAAIDANASDWSSSTYSDSITLTSSDGSHNDFNATNLDEDTRPVGFLCGAGAVYDHAAGCVWVTANTTAGRLYRITGIATNTWSVERFDSVVPRYSEAGTLQNYHRFALAAIGAAKVLIRVTGVDHPIQVLRIS